MTDRLPPLTPARRPRRGRRLASPTSPAGRCRCATPATSPSTTPCAPPPASSTSRTWPRSWSSARRPAAPSTTRSPASSRRSPIGQAKYSCCSTRDGGIVDDLVVYRTGDDRFMVVANAGEPRRSSPRSSRDRAAPLRREVDDESDDIALIAVQGPRRTRSCCDRRASRSTTVLDGDDFGEQLDALKYYRVLSRRRSTAQPVLVARTGYTGEDGFELYVAPDAAARALGRARSRPAAARARARGPREPRHAAPRGGHAAVRPRARPRHLARAGGPRPRRRTSTRRRLRRPRRPSRRGPAGCRACSSAWSPRASAPRGPATPVYAGATTATRRSASSRAARCRRRSAIPIAMAYVDAAVAAPGTRARRRRARHAHPAHRHRPALLQRTKDTR